MIMKSQGKLMQNCITGFITALIFIAGCDVEVNKPIRVKDGESRDHDLVTVNGSIIIGRDCHIDGTCRTVNGGIEVGKSSHISDLHSINGNIYIEQDVIIQHDVETINGTVRILTGTEIGQDVITVNGRLELSGVTVGRDIASQAGDIFCVTRLKSKEIS